jgi:thiol:disulfide interchange protein
MEETRRKSRGILTLLALVAALPLAAWLLKGDVAMAESGPKHLTDPAKALAQAKKTGKLVMMDVYTDWCGWCKRLDADVYAKPDVAKAIEKDFVFLKINPEKSAANRKFVDKYGVRGYPAIIFLNGAGKEVHRIDGYVPAPEFMKEMEKAKAAAKKR